MVKNNPAMGLRIADWGFAFVKWPNEENDID
jgi:hypothetical protein